MKGRVVFAKPEGREVCAAWVETGARRKALLAPELGGGEEFGAHPSITSAARTKLAPNPSGFCRCRHARIALSNYGLVESGIIDVA